MLRKLKNVFIITTGSFLLLTPAFIPAIASAQPDIQDSLCSGTVGNLDTNNETDCSTTNAGSSSSLNGILTTVINIFSIIVGAVSVIMIIIGGLRYITSGGNDTNIAGAKNTIVYALIGLVIVALAQVIVHFVLAKAISGSST